MPRLIDPGDGDAIELADLVDTLETLRFDPHDEDGFAALGPLLARLGRNRRFLADLAIAELKTRCRAQSDASSYGAQVFLLRAPDGRFAIRANFWPAADDAVTRASGPAAFFYGMAHDHNFPFLTYGYSGPGYWSDYYELGEPPVGIAGAPARLTFAGRERLEPGRLMLYRRHRDIHAQLPPDAFSVSLNILGQHPTHRWTDQYRFDIAAGTVAEELSHAPAEALLAIGAQLSANGRDLAESFARRHPAPRMRARALIALASATAEPDRRAELLARGADDADPRVAAYARRALDQAARAGARTGE